MALERRLAPSSCGLQSKVQLNPAWTVHREQSSVHRGFWTASWTAELSTRVHLSERRNVSLGARNNHTRRPAFISIISHSRATSRPDR